MPVPFDVVCLSHLRWDFVYQRPQHLLSRCAPERRVFFVEEPKQDSDVARLESTVHESGVRIVVPHLPDGLDRDAAEAAQQALIDDLLAQHDITDYVLWYYTPMALGFTRHLRPLATIYDCMDELSRFRGAPRALHEREADLFRRADLVFTGGQSLYEAKRHQHPRVHLFPSSVDVEHFARARAALADPADQVSIPHPRLGYVGVIDERMDYELIAGVARLRPDWQIVMVGPTAKVDRAELPQGPNIHYLGPKNYRDLPTYLAGWDVGLLPFARNDATRFISPTKTPEYLAAGRSVVSTSIRDVVRPYGEQGLVRFADTPADFVAAAEAAMQDDAAAHLRRVDALLAQNSWDRTWACMSELIESVVDARLAPA